MVTLRSIRRLRKEYPKVWAQLMELWDPNDVYIRRFEASVGSPTTTTPSNLVDIDSRFGDSSKVEVADTNVPSVKPYPPKPVSTTTNTPSTSTVAAAPKVEVTTPPPVATTKKPTTTPLTVTYGGGGLGLNTVSFRPPDLGVKGLVESIGSIGTKVIRAGTRIAGMLISSVQSVVGH